MHLLALTAGAVLASIAPTTAPPGEPPNGLVPAGIYTLEDSVAGAPFTVTLTVPEGWTYDPQFSSLHGFGDTAYILPIWMELNNNVPIDNCAWKDSDVITVETAAELAAALAEQPGSLVSTPQPLHIDSYTGVVFTAAPIPATNCDDGHQMVVMDDTPDGWWFHGDGIHDVKTFLALDFESGLGVIEVGTYAPLLPEQQRELLAIIDSIDVVENP